MNFKKILTHRVASGFLKYVSTCITLHSTAKQRVTNALMNVDLNENDITALKECVSTNTNHNPTNKRNPDGNRKYPAENSNTIVFPAFDLSTKRVEFGNGNARVTAVAYEILCHPDHANLLKSILIKSSVLDSLPLSGNHTHFILYGLIQTTDYTTVKNQIIQHNQFLAQTGIVPILNFTKDTRTSGLKECLLALPSVIGLEPLYSNEKSGQWLVVVKKSQKDQARNDIDQIINDTIFPDYQVDTPGRSNRYNTNTVVVTYTAILQKEATPTTIQFQNLPQYTVKQHIRSSYDLENIDSFPTIGK